MDEPFGALDEQTRMVLGEELSRILEKTGVTIVFVTHSLSEAVYLSDRVVVMSSRPGRVKTILRVPEDRPRDSSFMTSDVFTKMRNELFELLHDEVRFVTLHGMDEPEGVAT
jgi:ABC-type nitrate/sulfonate/bicarbonate transport system, ATPase component